MQKVSPKTKGQGRWEAIPLDRRFLGRASLIEVFPWIGDFLLSEFES